MLPLLAQGPLRRVEHLHLSAWPPTLSFDLIALRFFHDLRTLVLAACHAVDSSVLHHLQECQSLRSIDISSCGALSETDIACLAALPSLEGIVLARNPHMFLKREQLRPLEALTALTRLDLGDTWLDVASYTDQGASFSASHPLLRHLCLANSLSDEGTAVAALLGTQLKHLADLSLRNARGMPDEALAAIARCSGLECLDVAGARFVTDDGIGALGQLKRLVALDLGRCRKVTDKGISHIAAPTLTSLSLYKLRAITDAAIASVASALPALRHLELGHCVRLTDASIDSLAAGLTRLTRLGLELCTGLTERGLSRLSGMPRLASLDLAHLRRVTDGLVAQLCGEQGSVRVLRLTGCLGVSDSGVLAAVGAGVLVDVSDCPGLSFEVSNVAKAWWIQSGLGYQRWFDPGGPAVWQSHCG